jgi:hypothetical protein
LKYGKQANNKIIGVKGEVPVDIIKAYWGVEV